MTRQKTFPGGEASIDSSWGSKNSKGAAAERESDSFWFRRKRVGFLAKPFSIAHRTRHGGVPGPDIKLGRFPRPATGSGCFLRRTPLSARLPGRFS